MVQQSGRRSCQLLCIHLQEFQDYKCQPLRRCRAWPEGIGDDCYVSAGGSGLHCVERGPHFKFTPSISLYVNCETQAEVDEMWNKLSAGGRKDRCGWLQDKYGLSWQIVPTAVQKLMSDLDPKKTASVMQAILEMDKIDITRLHEAHDRAA